MYYSIFQTVAPIEVGCSSDDECASTQACQNRACVNPCAYNNPCASTAECTVNSHIANCKCPPGFTGDPYTQCVPSKSFLVDIVVRMKNHDTLKSYSLPRRMQN